MNETQTPSRRDLLARSLAELRAAKARVATLEAAAHEAVAIVGVGCRLPGGVESLDQLWTLLRDEVDATGEPPGRWDPARDEPPWMYTRRGAYLDGADGIEGFDARFFAVSSREAASLDPQQRLLLEVSWRALEHAAIATDRLRGARAGVFFGLSASDYGHLLTTQTPIDRVDGFFGSGVALNFAAGRVAHLLGVHGPAMVIDTACSSSLVAVHQACASLRTGECDLALAGGVNLILSPLGHAILCRAQVLSPEGRCKTFSADADGYARGEGCGVVVLRRLGDALREGDRVLAVIRGSAINHDGPSSGLMAPNPGAQRQVIAAALAAAGVEAREIGYVEAHGTGTALGDPIEVRALAEALGSGRERPVLIGALKANLGHLEAAAGVAGLLKLVACLERGELPRQLHVARLNPAIDWERLPVAVVDRRRPWPEGRRLAGLSAFGASGTNAHLILEGPPLAGTDDVAGQVRAEVEARAELLILSARDLAALREHAGDLAEQLAGSVDVSATPEPDTPVPPATPSPCEPSPCEPSPCEPSPCEPSPCEPSPSRSLDLASLCRGAARGRARQKHSLALVASSTADLVAPLRSFAADEATATLVHGQRRLRAPRVAFACSGQGEQRPGMGRELLAHEPRFRAALERCDAHLRPLLGRSLIALLEGEADAEALADTALAQPLLVAFEWALAELWRSWGIEPALVMGHSLGELVAASIAGALTIEDTLTLAVRRGRLTADLAAPGVMIAAFCGEEQARRALGDGDAVALAAVNGPSEVVLAGAEAPVLAAVERLTRDGVETRRLPARHGFHSPLMDAVGARLEVEVGELGLAPRVPVLPLISNLDGALVEGSLSPDYFRRHLRQPVRFHDGLRTLADRGIDYVIEIGPGATLSAIARRLDEGPRWLPSLRAEQDPRATMLASLGALVVAGLEPDWSAVQGPGARLALPPTRFRRHRHWFVADSSTKPSLPAADSSSLTSNRDRDRDREAHPLIGHRVDRPDGVVVFERRVGADAPAVFREHRVYDRVVVSGAVHAAMIEQALLAQCGAQARFLVRDVEFSAPFLLPEDGEVTVALAFEGDPSSPAGARVTLTAGDARGLVTVTEAHVEPLATPAPPPRRDLDALRARCTETLAGEDFYARFWAAGEHELGPVYRTITTIHRRDGEALAALRPPAVDPGEGLDEALVQGIALSEVYGQILMPAVPGYAAVLTALEHTFLGHGMARVVDHARAPARARWAHARLRRFDGDELVGDVALLDEAGAVLSVVEGLRARRVPASFLRLRLEAAAAAVPSFDLRALEAAPLGERRGLLARYVGERIAAVVGGAPDFGGDEPLASLGFDSLMVVELHRDLRLGLAVTPPPAASLLTLRVDELVDRLGAALLQVHGEARSNAAGLDPRLRRLGDRPAARGAPRLLCLGDPARFEGWRPALGDDLEVVLALSPSRGPLPPRLRAAATAAALLEPALSLTEDARPLALIGAGEGAREALALARALLDRGVAIERIYVQGAAPSAGGRPAAYADAVSTALVRGARQLGALTRLVRSGRVGDGPDHGDEPSSDVAPRGRDQGQQRGQQRGQRRGPVGARISSDMPGQLAGLLRPIVAELERDWARRDPDRARLAAPLVAFGPPSFAGWGLHAGLTFTLRPLPEPCDPLELLAALRRDLGHRP